MLFHKNIFTFLNCVNFLNNKHKTKKKFLALKKSLSALIFKFWEVGDKILTNHAYDVYEMSPYLIEMKSWLVELDEQKKDKEKPIII